MKFKKIRRPGSASVPVAHERPRIIRRQAEVCPWCGAVESMRAYATKRIDGVIYRYSTCSVCGKPVTRVIFAS